MSMSEKIDELAAALVAAQTKLPKIHKGETANVGRYAYSYADLPDIKENCDPIINAEGLAVTQWPSVHEQGPSLTTMLLHTSGQWISNEMLLLITDRTSQGQGSGLTYAKRYAYCAVLGIAPDKDDDGAAASRPADRPSTAPDSERPFVEGDPLDALDPGPLFKRGNQAGIRQRLSAWCKEEGLPARPIEMDADQRARYLEKIIELEKA
jgi:hypothetical protein